jgi:HK97 family phage major capsid protein
MAREDLQETIETLNKGWEEFKAEHKKGSAADKEKLARIEADIASADAKNQAAVVAKEAETKALKAQIDELEKKFNRGGLPGAGDREQQKLEEKERWVTALRYGHPDLTPGAEVKWEEERKRKGLKLEHKALTMSDDTAGGYLSGPADYIREIIKAEVLYSPVRGLVRVRQTSMRNVQIPKRTGTAAASWVGENQTRTEATNPAYGLVDCATHEMSAEVYVSFQDLEDSAFDLEAELTQEFAEQFSVTEGLAVVAGNGKEKPWGFTDAGQAVPTTNSGNGTSIADANGQANGIISMVHAVKSAYAVRGKFVLARATLGLGPQAAGHPEAVHLGALARGRRAVVHPRVPLRRGPGHAAGGLGNAADRVRGLPAGVHPRRPPVGRRDARPVHEGVRRPGEVPRPAPRGRPGGAGRGDPPAQVRVSA